MSFLDFIKNLFNTNKKYAKIIANDLNKTYGDSAQLEVALYEDDVPLIGKEVTIHINSKDYYRKTDNDGIARLNINLPVGEYDAHVSFDNPDYTFVRTFVNVNVNPVIETSDLSMFEGDGSRFTATLKDNNGSVLSGVKFRFEINGRAYGRVSDDNGQASLGINLNHGEYVVETVCCSMVKRNKITVNPPHQDTGAHFGYWVFGKDMLDVNLQNLKDCGVTDLFLNYYAFTAHSESRVLDWINQANNLDLHVHIWMQCFYDGEWHNPVDTDLSGKIAEAEKYAGMPGVYGVHLDYLRYPGNAYKTEGAVEAINNFVKRVKEVTRNKFL